MVSSRKSRKVLEREIANHHLRIVQIGLDIRVKEIERDMILTRLAWARNQDVGLQVRVAFLEGELSTLREERNDHTHWIENLTSLL